MYSKTYRTFKSLDINEIYLMNGVIVKHWCGFE